MRGDPRGPRGGCSTCPSITKAPGPWGPVISQNLGVWGTNSLSLLTSSLHTPGGRPQLVPGGLTLSPHDGTRVCRSCDSGTQTLPSLDRAGVGLVSTKTRPTIGSPFPAISVRPLLPRHHTTGQKRHPGGKGTAGTTLCW